MGKITFGSNPNEDKLKLKVEFPAMNPAIDPAASGVTIVLRDDDEILAGAIPAAAIETKTPGRKWQYKDKLGTIAGIKQLQISVSGTGQGQLKLGTVKTDLAAADARDHDIELVVGIGDLTSTAKRAWAGDAKKLATVKQ